MSGVTFNAWRDGEFIPLVEVLLTIGRWAISVHWRLSGAEFGTGWRGSGELNAMSDHAPSISTAILLDLVSDGIQMIDGELLAYSPTGEALPFLIIRSIRGDEWDVQSDVSAILDELKIVYNAIELPGRFSRSEHSTGVRNIEAITRSGGRVRSSGPRKKDSYDT